MRYVYTIVAVAYAVSGIGAGEVWVVKPKPRAVWVVRKTTKDFLQKTCPCSPACVCGCNEGKPCTCEQPTQTATQWQSGQNTGQRVPIQSAICLPGGG